MNAIKTGLASVVALVGFTMASPGALAQSEEPIIEFHTNIYESQGAQNAFTIRLGTTETDFFDVDCGFGTEEVEVGPAVFDTETSSIKATVVSCGVNPDGVVRIYGDASKIDYIDFEGCFIDRIDIGKCTGATILDLRHNELKALDLTAFSKLQALYLTDNPFTAETPLKVGGNKPDLMILELDIIDHLDQSFNLSDYPALVTFDGYHNMDLRSLDPSGCPELQALSVELAPVASLDVSKNLKLTRLNISDSRITSIDISHNRNLQYFLAAHTSGTINTDVKLGSVDLTNNPNLIAVNLGGNDLKEVDLSKNTYLINLTLRNNNLSTIDLSANTNLYSVDLAYNDLDFATLPLPQDTWGEYYYNRHPLPCRKSYAIGEELDFSSRVLRQGTSTSVRVWRAPIDADAELVELSDYEYSNGKITFSAVSSDSLYVEFINSAFPEYTLTSGKFMVKNTDEIGKPTKIAAMKLTSAMGGKELAIKVGMDNATADTPKTFYVDPGDGTQLPFTATTVEAPGTANLKVTLPASISGEVSVLIPENETLTALEIRDVPMSSLNLQAATELRWLTVTGCNLSAINLATNRCLQTLDLSGNRLGTLDLAGVRGDYEKFVLREINASNNRIFNFNIVGNRQIQKLDLSHNLLSTFVLKDYNSLVDLDLSHNRLKEDLNLAYLEQTERIDLSNNNLTSLVLVDMPHLKTFNISGNRFSLQNLPYLTGVAAGVYVYAPQQDIAIAEVAPGVNLTDQNRVIDGKGSVFTWKKAADGTLLVEGVDMTCKDGGTRFLKDDLGKVYCEITNPAFPDFAGSNVLKTTEVTVTGAPTNVVASFTTTASGNNGEVIFTGSKVSALYIDWRGDGTEYIQYPINGDMYTAYPGQTYYAGAEVKVYTYESAEDIKVFSVYDVPMSRMDASPLTNLIAFSVSGAGLDEDSLVFPESPALAELTLSGNNFSSMDVFKPYPGLRNLNISGNRYESFAASALPALETLMAGNNGMSAIEFNNPTLWGVDLMSNNFTGISLENAPALSQLVIANNKLSTIDLTPVKDIIVALDVQRNSFDFSTLPVQADYPMLTHYRFTGQQPIAAECIEGKVDLSAQAEVGGNATAFRWFLGEVTIDADSGELVGEELETGGDDPEFTVEKGVTTFHYDFTDKVTGVMTNPLFENLILYTLPLSVNLSGGISGVAADGDAAVAPVDVYTIAGVKVRSQVMRSEATEGLAPGFYIVGGSKVLVK